MLPILYSFRRCPYAMRARLALVYSETVVELREILLKDKPESMLEFSSKGTVPVLVVGEKVIDESLDVMKWALAQKDSDQWFVDRSDEVQQQILALIEQNDHQFKPILDKYKYSDRHPESEQFYRNKSFAFLNDLNLRLSKHNYLFGKQITLADMAIFPFIRQYAFVDKTWFDNSEYDALKSWLEELLHSELFLSIMHKHQPWKQGDYIEYQPFKIKNKLKLFLWN